MSQNFQYKIKDDNIFIWHVNSSGYIDKIYGGFGVGRLKIDKILNVNYIEGKKIEVVTQEKNIILEVNNEKHQSLEYVNGIFIYDIVSGYERSNSLLKEILSNSMNKNVGCDNDCISGGCGAITSRSPSQGENNRLKYVTSITCSKNYFPCQYIVSDFIISSCYKESCCNKFH